MASGLLISILTARALGVAGRGEYFYVMTLANLATQFGNLGLASSNTYSLTKDNSLLPRLTANCFWVSVVVGVVSVVGVLTIEVARGASSRMELTICLLMMVPSMIYGLLASNLLVGLSRIRQYNYFLLGSAGIQLAAIAFATWIAWGVGAILWFSTISGVMAAGVLWLMLRQLHPITWRFDWQVLRSHLGYANRAYVATLLVYGVSRASVLLLDHYSDKTELGLYSVAVQLADALVVVPTTVAMVLFPDLVKRPADCRLARTMRVAGQIALIMAALCVSIGWVAAWIVPAVFGESFTPAVRILWWMLPGVFAFSLTTIVSQYLAAHGIPPANVWAWLGGLVFLLASGSQLIPRWGVLGAAVSLSLTYVLMVITIVLLALKYAAWESRRGIKERYTIWTPS
jgi:O-antigen/teichoic acid export membrane protein